MKRSTTKRSSGKTKSDAVRHAPAVFSIQQEDLRKIFAQHFIEGRGSIAMAAQLAIQEADALIATLFKNARVR